MKEVDIDIRYRIPLVGKYNKMVSWCPYCNHDTFFGFFDNVCGIADSPIGLVKISECPMCHEKYYSHCGYLEYQSFLTSILKGTNKFFKAEGREKEIRKQILDLDK